jgi:hypothetical protein
MNLNHILKAIQGESTEQVTDRRDILKSFGSKVALAAMPLAIGSLFKKANAQSIDEIFAAMNLVLKYEYLTYTFYNKMLANGPVFPTANGVVAFEKIKLQKDQHINFLNWIITNNGGTALASPLLDMSGGQGSGAGPFADSLTDYRKMLMLGQMLEDTCIRVYKGQLTTLIGKDSMLSSVISLHAASAKYAAHIRRMRAEAGNDAVKPWITGDKSETDNAYMQSYYAGEAQTTQLGITIPGINGQNINFDSATESFDEPVSEGQAMIFIQPFIIP